MRTLLEFNKKLWSLLHVHFTNITTSMQWSVLTTNILYPIIISAQNVDGDILWAISCGPEGERSDAANLKAQERELHF